MCNHDQWQAVKISSWSGKLGDKWSNKTLPTVSYMLAHLKCMRRINIKNWRCRKDVALGVRCKCSCEIFPMYSKLVRAFLGEGRLRLAHQAVTSTRRPMYVLIALLIKRLFPFPHSCFPCRYDLSPNIPRTAALVFNIPPLSKWLALNFYPYF